MAEAIKTPYTGAKRLIPVSGIPNWMNEYDATRIASYSLYEDIYWTEPQTFKLQQRGKEENPIYVPSGRIIVNTMNRYMGKGWAPTPDPAFGTPEQQGLAIQTFTNLFRRERMGSQYNSNKLYGCIRGDWFLYITADATKPQGSRLTIRGIDPAMVFPINAPKDTDRILGYDLVEQVVEGDNTYIKRTRYLKSEHELHPSGGGVAGGPISFQVDILEIEDWETDDRKFVRTDFPPALLPADITTLPVYHFKNIEEPQNPFGISEMRGIERLMAAVNQAITDEELALALEGLGMYRSGKGQPIHPVTKQPVPWQLGPGKVVHDDTFERVTGVNTVGPFQEHIKYLENKMNEVSGASDVARGIVDVTVAESGVALALRMGPILDSADQRETVIREVMDQFLFDLQKWLKAYEGINLEGTQMISTFGNKLPTNVKDEFDRLLAMYSADPPLITAAYFRDACRELGISIPVEVTGAAIAEEQASMAEVMDPYGSRVQQEIDNADADAGV